MLRNYISSAVKQNALILHVGLIILTLLFSASALAADPAGRLLFVRGDVQIASVEAEPRTAKRGDVLQVGDTISTGSASSAQLRMSDGAMVALKAGTVYRIEAQDYNKKAPGKGSQVGELLRGGLRAITGAIGHEKPEAVKYRTPVATIGIRGTVFDTIYIPPEGLPELPGMAPGAYVMVLEGQVLLSSTTGELLLGPGEVGYVPFVGAPPELRPDLASIFVEFASLEEDKPKTSTGQKTYSRTAFQSDGRLYTLMADVAADQILSQGTGATTSPGPYAITNHVLGFTTYQGDFFNNPVTVGASGELQNATGGSGSISRYQLFNLAANILNAGTVTAGDSNINWGQYTGLDVNIFDAVNAPIGLTSTDLVNYITATNVIVSVVDLPTTGSYTYSYVGGSGEILNAGSNLSVNFGTGTMGVTLVGGLGSYTASNQAISNFYGNGISLNGPSPATQTGNSISGRFVGSSAEGAVAGFVLNLSDGMVMGTGAFVR